MDSSITERADHWQEYRNRWAFQGDGEDAVRIAGSMGPFEARMQYDFLVERGLKPEHRFLDLGCGCLRGTIRLVDYLSDGNFYGADVSLDMLKAALMEVDRLKMAHIPFLQIIDSFNLSRMFMNKFDYILCNSVIPYLHPDDIGPMFKGIAGVMQPEGRLFITLYPLAEAEGSPFIKEPYLWWYKKSWLAKKAAENGIDLIDPSERFECRLPKRGKPVLPIVNSNLTEWVMEGRLHA